MSKNGSSNRRSFLKEQLMNESRMLADDSMAVLEEFEIFEEGFSREELGKKDHGGKGDE